MYFQGVNATTLGDVRTASGTSKSQLYRHFPDKAALVHAVITAQSATILARERPARRAQLVRGAGPLAQRPPRTQPASTGRPWLRARIHADRIVRPGRPGP